MESITITALAEVWTRTGVHIPRSEAGHGRSSAASRHADMLLTSFWIRFTPTTNVLGSRVNPDDRVGSGGRHVSRCAAEPRTNVEHAARRWDRGTLHKVIRCSPAADVKLVDRSQILNSQLVDIESRLSHRRNDPGEQPCLRVVTNDLIHVRSLSAEPSR